MNMEHEAEELRLVVCDVNSDAPLLQVFFSGATRGDTNFGDLSAKKRYAKKQKQRKTGKYAQI